MWRRSLEGLALAAAGILWAWAGAATGASEKAASKGEAVGLFEGMEAGKIEARLVPRNARRCRVFLTNKTDQPLTVELPEAFAGVPVLAQFQPGGPNDGGPNPQAPQRIGGPFPPGIGLPNNPGQNPLLNPGNRPFMNLPPEKTLELKLTTVCLDYGNPDPRPTVQYELCPVQKAIDAPAVAELCGLMGRGNVSHEVAQAAAWHLASGKTWDELRAMRTSKIVPTKPRFSKKDLEAARALADEAVQLAKKQPEPATNP